MSTIGGGAVQLNAIDIVVIIAYFVIVMAFGVWVSQLKFFSVSVTYNTQVCNSML